MRDSNRLASLLSLLAILLVASFGGVYWMGQITLLKAQHVASEQNVIDVLEGCLSTLKDAETGQRGFLLTGEQSYLGPYKAAVDRIGEQQKILAQLARDGYLAPEDQGALTKLVSEKLAELSSTVELRNQGKADEALAIVRTNQGKRLMDDIRDLDTRLAREENEDLQTARATANRFTGYRTFTFGVVTLIDLLFLFWAYKALEREAGLRAVASQEVRRQKDLLDITLASIGDGVIVTDSAGHISFMNTVAENLTGWTFADARGKPCATVFHIVNEDSRVPVESPVDKVLATGVIVGLANHTLLIRKDGKELPIDDSGAPIRNTDGQIHGVVLVFRDFTEFKAAELQLRNSSNQIRSLNIELRERVTELETLLAVAPIGLAVTTDSKGQNIRANPALARLLRVQANSNISQSHDAPAPPGYKVFYKGIEIGPEGRPLEIAAATGKPVDDDEYEIEFEDGTRLDLLGGAAPLFDADGKPRGAIGAYFDISERKRYEADLRRAKDSAETANLAKDRFLAMLSHELRTPLSPVMATLSNWEVSDEIPEHLREDVMMMRRNIDLEARLIDDLLDLNRIVSGKLQLHLEVADIHSLLQSVIGMYQSEIRIKGVRMSLTLNSRQRHVRGDPGRLQQVFWNILKNAAKFTPSDGLINVAVTDDGGNILLTFADTGIGMTQETIARIFRPFEQGDSEMVRRAGGLGLGMAISKLLIDLQGGIITASSPGQGLGSTFKISLPAVEAPIETTRSNLPSADSAPNPTRGKPLSILLVEDHVDTARAMSRLLSRLGHKVEVRDTVAGAVEISQTWQYDVLLSDIGLPDGTGLDLIQQIKAMRQVPSIALTGYGMEEDVAKCREAGFDSHLTKPVNFQKLEMMIQEIVAKAGSQSV